jgi:pyridoxal phosphate enzyme (YggS family)
MVGAFRAGLMYFGESRPVEALEKRALLPLEVEQAVTWHFIGHLQRNKVNKVVGHYALIHSVDSFELLEAISKRARALSLVQGVLLQVNVSGELSKQGFTPPEVEAVLLKAKNLEGVRALGLMTIAPKEADEAQQAMIFSQCQALKQHAEMKSAQSLEISSMGMTQDYSQALVAGATIVRIGNKLFT